jgi:hypothetical protein
MRSTRPQHLFGPVFGLWVMAFGGLLLHARIHPPSKDALNWIGVGFPLFNAFVLPWLFLFRRTVPWAYLINVTSVVVGVATMTWFSFTHWDQPVTFKTVLLASTFADSLILLAKLPLAHAILLAWRERDGKESAS